MRFFISGMTLATVLMCTVALPGGNDGAWHAEGRALVEYRNGPYHAPPRAIALTISRGNSIALVMPGSGRLVLGARWRMRWPCADVRPVTTRTERRA